MRLDQLTFSRFIAAIAVVIYHYGLEVYPFNLTPIQHLFQQGNIAVSYFFMLSGFIMIIAYHHYKEIDFLAYIKKRFARIYPVYFLALIFVLAFKIYYHKESELGNLFLNLTMLQSWIPGKALSFNYPAWSLAVEFFFYALFPYVFNTYYSKISFKKLIIPIVSIFSISQLLFHWGIYSEYYEGYPSKFHDFLFYFPPMHLAEFLIGNLAGLYFIKVFLNKRKNYDLVIMLLLCLVPLAIYYNSTLNFHNGLLAILFIPLILLISANTGFITTFSKYKPLVFLGEISYGIYILQSPIFAWTKAFLKDNQITNETSKFYIATLVLILCSALCFIYIETPLRKILKKI
ncbi:acyltransferase [Cellulophaga sp. E16_2]|uniref:acyltransferase family protein n=1 Tax=Cellulophaga sp. E16_2 TaxID=2789297 RepID=UPI001A926E9A|nr:acyltransferase [Cellulophaga sp. E16_2]MBO0592581.1 acyltransferase [Cellulophaga sp. E16_2]